MTGTGWKRTLAGAAAALAVVLLAMPAAEAAGTPAGTVISNQATVTYEDANANSLTQLSNVVTTTVSQVAAVVVAPDNSSAADPGDVVAYAHQVTNNGNGPDTIDLTASSSQGWTVALYLDVNGDGLFDPGDTLLADSDGDGTPDTGSLAADASVDVIVTVTVPAGAANGVSDVTTVTGAASFDNGATTDSALDTTTVTSPALAVVKSVSPAGDQPPGTVLTYTIVMSNNGSATANNVVMTDPIPPNTTYVAGSITVDGAARTDAADADSADYNVTNAGQVTVNVGALAAGGASSTVTFSVRID